jgi:hypothetical protein
MISMASKNKYVDFVSDEDFLECVKEVCDEYPSIRGEMSEDEFKKNGLDPFKKAFDIGNTGMTEEEWIATEIIRQQDKTINNAVGYFHQRLLGKVHGWTDLGVGNESKLDLLKNDNTIFMELKNKHNTINGDSLAKCREKLEKAVREHPGAVAYWAYINNPKGTSGESKWEFAGVVNPSIKKAWGAKVYEIVTEDPNAFEKTLKALPIAIRDNLKTRAP